MVLALIVFLTYHSGGGYHRFIYQSSTTSAGTTGMELYQGNLSVAGTTNINSDLTVGGIINTTASSFQIKNSTGGGMIINNSAYPTCYIGPDIDQTNTTIAHNLLTLQLDDGVARKHLFRLSWNTDDTDADNKDAKFGFRPGGQYNARDDSLVLDVGDGGSYGVGNPVIVFNNDKTVTVPGGLFTASSGLTTAGSVKLNSNNGYWTNLQIGTGHSSQTRLYVTSDVTSTGYATIYAAISDQSDDRIKTDEEDIIDATSTIPKLRPQNYKHGIFESGIIVQELYYNAPNCVIWSHYHMIRVAMTLSQKIW